MTRPRVLAVTPREGLPHGAARVLLIRSLASLLAGLSALILANGAQAQSVSVEYHVLSETTTDQGITQSLEVRITNTGVDAMFGTSGALTIPASVPMAPLGQVAIGDIPVGYTASGIVDISFSVANEAIVRGSNLLFALSFLDVGGQSRQVFAVGTKVP